jgi:hypothetical protein
MFDVRRKPTKAELKRRGAIRAELRDHGSDDVALAVLKAIRLARVLSRHSAIIFKLRTCPWIANVATSHYDSPG